MNKKIQNFTNRASVNLSSSLKFMIPVAILTAMLQLPVSNVLDKALSIKTVYKAVADVQLIPIAEAFFGSDATTSEAQEIVDKQMEFVSTRGAYSASLAVVEKHEEVIKEVAREKGVPEDVAIGVAFLENGGSDTAKSSAGAMGVFQLMPGTARNLGLKVTKDVDERKNPEQNIEAGITYLAKNYERFGDWGLSTWAYHAGEGNVAKAIKIYAKEHDEVDLTGIKDFPEMKEYVEANDITIHKLLSDPKVHEFTEKLNDDSNGYPYKVVATATLFKGKGNSKKDQ